MTAWNDIDFYQEDIQRLTFSFPSVTSGSAGSFMDATEELTPAQVKAYVDFKLARGSVVLNNGRILPSRSKKMVIDRLYEDERLIEDHHRSAAISLKILYDCAHTDIFHEGDKNSAGQGMEPKIKYIAVISQISKLEFRMLEWIILGDLDDDDFRLLRAYRQSLVNAIESLREALKEENIQLAIDRRRQLGYDQFVTQDKCV